MGYIFEELIRRFSEASNESAGEHFTPREVIRLMVNLLLHEDDDVLRKPGSVRTLYDPACGTGGMLTVAESYMRDLNPQSNLEVFGQELNPETWAICRSDMLLTGHDPSHIVLGNSFSTDGLPDEKFDYMLANPPFGVEWKKVKDEVETEYETLGFKGRFGAGLPRINDGSFLFLQHMISKMRPVEQGGSRLAIVFNGSPLFTGAAGSGESEIRRWILENDWLEGIVALPEQLFYNTGISTYFWVLSNRKSPEREGKVALVDAREMYVRMRKSLGNKRREINGEQIEQITNLYADALALATEGSPQVKVLNTTDFGYQRITRATAAAALRGHGRHPRPIHRVEGVPSPGSSREGLRRRHRRASRSRAPADSRARRPAHPGRHQQQPEGLRSAAQPAVRRCWGGTRRQGGEGHLGRRLLPRP